MWETGHRTRVPYNTVSNFKAVFEYRVSWLQATGTYSSFLESEGNLLGAHLRAFRDWRVGHRTGSGTCCTS